MKVMIFKKKHSSNICIFGYLLEEEGPSCIERNICYLEKKKRKEKTIYLEFLFKNYIFGYIHLKNNVEKEIPY
jgi:hypothetical protein